MIWFLKEEDIFVALSCKETMHHAPDAEMLNLILSSKNFLMSVFIMPENYLRMFRVLEIDTFMGLFELRKLFTFWKILINYWICMKFVVTFLTMKISVFGLQE